MESNLESRKFERLFKKANEGALRAGPASKRQKVDDLITCKGIAILGKNEP